MVSTDSGCCWKLPGVLEPWVSSQKPWGKVMLSECRLKTKQGCGRKKMNHGFWVFLRTPMGSWAVSYAVPGLSERPPKPASVVAPPTYSPPHLPI